MPVASMPGALEWFAEINPVTYMVDAMPCGSAPRPARSGGRWSGRLVLIAIFAPIASLEVPAGPAADRVRDGQQAGSLP